jgi:hypothetical protein
VKDTHIKIKIRISSLKEAKGGDPKTKKAYNAITTKSVDTMNWNEGKRKHINT